MSRLLRSISDGFRSLNLNPRVRRHPAIRVGPNPHFDPTVMRVETLDFGLDGSVSRTFENRPLDWRTIGKGDRIFVNYGVGDEQEPRLVVVDEVRRHEGAFDLMLSVHELDPDPGPGYSPDEAPPP